MPRGRFIGRQIQVFESLAHDPVGHRIHIPAEDVASETVGLEKWRSSAHEGVRDPDAAQLMRLEVGL